MATGNNNVHDRHPEPGEGENFDPGTQKPAESKPTEGKQTAQEIRDAHYLENGVKADGTTGDLHYDATGKRVQAPPKDEE